MHIIYLLICFILFIKGEENKLPSEEDDTSYWTTNYGAPVDNNDDSLTVGARGPTLLEDYTLLEKLANFDRYILLP